MCHIAKDTGVGVRTAEGAWSDVGDRWQVLVAGLTLCGLWPGDCVELHALSLVFWKQNQP